MEKITKKPLERKQRGAVYALCVVFSLLFLVSGCGNQDNGNKDNDEPDEPVSGLGCDCEEELYYYANNGDKIFLGNSMLNDYLFIIFVAQAKVTEIVDYLNQTGLFETVIEDGIYDNLWEYHNHMMFVCIKEQKTCSQLKEIIQMLEREPIVICANLAFTDDICVWSFLSIFGVETRHESGSESDLYAVAQETNTWVIESDARIMYHFDVGTDKNSKGNAMQMANYFFETGKFIFAKTNRYGEELKNKK